MFIRISRLLWKRQRGSLNKLRKTSINSKSVEISSSSYQGDPSFSQSSCPSFFREISVEELAVDEEEVVNKSITEWTKDLAMLQDITHEKIAHYFVEGTISVATNAKRGATKHKVLGYTLFKDNYVKKVCVKPNIQGSGLLFIVKCTVNASMRKIKYEVYVHLSQDNGEIFYAKWNCRAGAGGCCKHVAAALYQLVDYKLANFKSIPDDKTCTDVLQQWHVPGEGLNTEAILFENLTFDKASAEKDVLMLRKRVLVTGKRDFSATPAFARDGPSMEKLQKLHKDLTDLNHGEYVSAVLKWNNFKPCTFYRTSVTEYFHSLKSQQEFAQEDLVNVNNIIKNLFENFVYKVEDTLLQNEDKIFVEPPIQ